LTPGKSVLDDLTGRRFGRLVVLARAPTAVSPKGKKITRWLCRCDCGAEPIKRAMHLKTGHTTSCGCKQREGQNRRHGDTHDRKHGGSSTEWVAWWSMIRRCAAKPGSRMFPHYAGRGIKVCDRWLGRDGYVNFLADMGRKPSPRHSLDRTDNDRGYEPTNCRWETRSHQNANRRLLSLPPRVDGRWSKKPDRS